MTDSEIPTRFDAERILLRSYDAGDGPWFYEMVQRNRTHLARYEAGNVVLTVDSIESAEKLVCELAAEWQANRCYFMGVFERASGEFVAQVYVGPLNRELQEYAVGYFADCKHEGQGYVTEAVRAALDFVFLNLKAHRARIECEDTNERSWKVAERCGFVREGQLHENKRLADGTWTGTLYYGLLRSEFQPETGPRFDPLT